MRRVRAAFCVLVVLGAGAAAAADAPPADPAPAMAAAAERWLASLEPRDRARASRRFDSPNRLDWHYVPRARQGVALQEMSPAARAAALDLLATGLSGDGFARVAAIRDLEEVLHAQSGWAMRDPGLFYFTVFGSPGDKGAWSWRYEGHHASLHWTIVDGRLVASAPQFLGANPAEVRSGSQRGRRALAAEEDLARELVRSLAPEKRRIAVLSDDAPGDILTRNSSPDATPVEVRGIAYRELGSAQQGLLLDLLRVYAAKQTPAIAEARLARVRAGLDAVRFAWMGGLERGQPHYYRIQGADFLVEYDNTQDGANHIHSVWRDKRGEWGRDLLAEHYRAATHGAARSLAAR